MKLWRYGTAIERLGGRYRLDGSLGSGGMADVCLAWDEREQREVAIKVIKSDDLDQETLDRFQKEAAQVVGWNHPHILRVYDNLKLELLDAAHGSIVPYIVVEYARGGDLHKRLRPNQPYSLAETLHLFEQICSAVQYAHNQAVIHRDLKPLNILFRVLPDGAEQAVLSDFGLAVQMDATHHTFARAGTLAYMAPEQLQGHSTAASDIFALGVILYQLCTGKLPFRRSLQDLRATSSDELPPAPSSINPLLPETLDEVILTALSTEQSKRYASAAQLWDHVRVALDATTRLDTTMLEEVNNGPILSSPHYTEYIPSAKLDNAVSVHQNREQIAGPFPISAPSFNRPMIDVAIEKYGEVVHNGKQNTQASPESSIMSAEMASAINAPAFAMPPGLTSHNHRLDATAPLPVAEASQTLSLKHPRKLPSRRLKGMVLAILAIVLISGGIYSLFTLLSNGYLHPSGQVANAVTITPETQDVKSNFTILAVTSTPDKAQRQVQARQLSYTSPVQSKTVNTTSVVGIPATQATGRLTFYNALTYAQTVGAGTVFSVGSVQIVNNGSATIPAAVPPTVGLITVSAHAVTTGSAGNIRAFAINGACCLSGVTVQNTAAFTGGQDAQHYTFVQQSDVDNVANPLVDPAEKGALSSVQTQKHSNEQYVGQPQCTPHVTANPPVGTKSNTVTVSVSATCSGEVYDQSGAVALAVTSLKNQASKDPGPNYALVGKINVAVTQANIVDSKGTVSLIVAAEGIWAYNFSDAQKIYLAQLIAGKNRQDATKVLLAQAGVGNVDSIAFASGSNAFPTDTSQISVVVTNVPGLSGTPKTTGFPTTTTPPAGPGSPQPGAGFGTGSGNS